VNDTLWRTPHIHFDIAGKRNRISAQILLPGEPLNDKDILIGALAEHLQYFTPGPLGKIQVEDQQAVTGSLHPGRAAR
jgi:protocatechuate 3,4-dioxygenase beta subunit